jgi:predicted TIM-barrel fold metal-dependent hydrolase
MNGIDPGAGAPEPLRRLPPGTCDCHFHIFDAARYPYAAERSYTPPDATLRQQQALLARYGIDRCVLIHPSVFGADHRSLEELLTDQAPGMRGVAVVYPQTRSEQIERWHALGVRGSRVNALFAGGPGLQSLQGLAAQIKPWNWHIQLLIDLVQSPHYPQQVADLGAQVVVDHMGHANPTALLSSPGLANLLALMAEGRAWVKLSAPYRLSDQGVRHPDLLRLAERFVRANPRRVVWGTDWPHPSPPYPLDDDDTLVGSVYDWLPDEQLRQQVLVRNPEVLYGFDPV